MLNPTLAGYMIEFRYLVYFSVSDMTTRLRLDVVERLIFLSLLSVTVRFSTPGTHAPGCRPVEITIKGCTSPRREIFSFLRDMGFVPPPFLF